MCKETGTAMVCVPRSVAARAKSMAKSLVIHDSHDHKSGLHSHFARNAAALAKPYISDVEFASANAAHRKANAAKHGGPVRVFDSVWFNDPWKVSSLAAPELNADSAVSAQPLAKNANLAALAQPIAIIKVHNSFDVLSVEEEVPGVAVVPQFHEPAAVVQLNTKIKTSFTVTTHDQEKLNDMMKLLTQMSTRLNSVLAFPIPL